MIAIQVARIIANFSLFLDLSDDETVDPDAAVQAMEELGAGLQALDKAFLRELVDAFAVIAPEYRGESERLVRNIPADYFLEEILADGDPVRLAELDARSEAEDPA